MKEEKEFSKSDYKTAGMDIYDKLHLSTYPIAVKYIKNENEIPRRAVRPSTMGHKKRMMSICQAFTVARKMGVTMALTAEENFCVPSSAIHGWIKVSKEEFIESQIRQQWHKSAEVEKMRAKMMLKIVGRDSFEEWQREGYIGVIASPLPTTLIVPDSIIIYGNGAQITHVIHSLCFDGTEEYIPTSIFEGFGESCGKGGLQPFLTQKPQIILPGTGDRAFAGIQEHEIGIGLPGSMIFPVLDNLFKTGGMQNMGFPVKNLIPIHLKPSLTPGFKYLWEIYSKDV